MSSHPLFGSLLGNDLVKIYLSRMVETDRVAQSLLFTGPSGVGKTLFAEAFASLLLGKPLNTPSYDLRLYRPVPLWAPAPASQA